MNGLRRRRPLAALLAVVLLWVLSGCSSIPLTGPVGAIPQPSVSDDDESSLIKAYGPGAGDDAASIVSGFLAAGADSSDDYSVARRFLTPELALSWNPTESSLIVDQMPTPTPVSGDTVWRTSSKVVRTIDANGVRADADTEQGRTLDFTLKRVGGEWRISSAADGIVVRVADFDRVFTPVTLYFYADAAASIAVPDPRWIARRKGLPTAVVAALMDGPSQYLRGVVTSAFPEGSTLSITSVPVENGTATVDLPAELASRLSDQDRRLMAQQLRLSLKDVSQVQDVQLSVDHTVIDLGTPEQQPPTPTIDPQVDATLVGLHEGKLVTSQNGTFTAVPGSANLPATLHAPALALSGSGIAVLNAARTRLLAVGEGGKVNELARGRDLVAPSFDARSWVWTASSASQGVIAARASGGKQTTLNPDWLSAVKVSSLRVSVDGTRLAIVGVENNTPVVFVSGIVRDGSGQPSGLTTPLRLKSSVRPTSVLWLSDSQLVVFRPSAADMLAVETLGLDGSTSGWTQKLRGVTALAIPAGSDQAVLGQTADGLYERKSGTWERLELALTDPSYRG
jgi:hypothetical protein